MKEDVATILFFLATFIFLLLADFSPMPIPPHSGAGVPSTGYVKEGDRIVIASKGSLVARLGDGDILIRQFYQRDLDWDIFGLIR